MLEKDVFRLNGLNAELERQKAELAEQLQKSQEEAADATKRLEGLTSLHESFKKQMEALKNGVVGSAIQSKLELQAVVLLCWLGPTGKGLLQRLSALGYGRED